MKIGIIGSGIVGQTLAAGFLKHGHQAMLGTRDPKKPDVQKWLADNPGAKAGTFEEVARFGEFLVLATAGKAAESALQLAGAANLAGKTVMDATNPIADDPPKQGVLPYFTGPNESLAERLQGFRRLPQGEQGFAQGQERVGAPLAGLDAQVFSKHGRRRRVVVTRQLGLGRVVEIVRVLA